MKILVEKSDIIWNKVMITIFLIDSVLTGIIANNMFLIIISIICIIEQVYQIVKISKIKNKHQR